MLERDAAGSPDVPTSAANGCRFVIITEAACAIRDVGIVLMFDPVSPYSLVKVGRQE